MNVLTIDAATQAELVAAAADERVADETRKTDASHSVTLFENIERALASLGITIRDINLIGVGIGPGSFTGVRIAVSTARMFAQALRVPIVGISSPLIYACSLDAAEGDAILIAFDAKKGRVFGGLYQRTANPVEPKILVPPGDYPIGALIEQADSRFAVHAAGDGALRYLSDLKSAIANLRFHDDILPSGGAACALARHIFASGAADFHDYNAILPHYARKSDAEIAKEKKGTSPSS